MRRNLIQHVHDHAMAGQCDRVYWLTHQSNETAQLLYDRVAKKSRIYTIQNVMARYFKCKGT